MKYSKKLYASYGPLEWRILDTAKRYVKLTVRFLYYILISKYQYPPSRRFYKILNYHLTKMRRVDPELNARFIDPTRRFIRAPMPYPEVELWVEKETIRVFLQDLAVKYRISIQILRGFASLSMYRKALQRAVTDAVKRGVRRVLYAGDFDPSGLLIEKVAEKEMGIEFKRVALTWEQIKKYRPPSIPVNRKDSRAKHYIAKYGNRCWEIESLRPRTFLKVVEEELRKHVPREYIAEAEARERAARIARPVTERLRKMIEREVFRLLEEGKTEGQILSQIASKYGLRLRRRRIKGDKTAEEG